MIADIIVTSLEIDGEFIATIIGSILTLIGTITAYLKSSIKTKHETLNGVNELNNRVKKLEDNSTNNIRDILGDIVAEEAKGKVGYKDLPDQGIHRYLKQTITDIVSAYYRVRLDGLHVLKSDDIKATIVNGVESTLRSCYYEESKGKVITYPNCFIEYVMESKSEMYEKCISNIYYDMSLVEDKSSYIEIVKSNLKTVFRDSIINLFNTYVSMKHLIGADISDSISSRIKNKDFINNLIAENKIDDAIKVAIKFYDEDKQAKNVLTLISSRYNKYKKDLMIGIIDPDPKLESEINNSLLDVTNIY